jgi:methyltransferase
MYSMFHFLFIYLILLRLGELILAECNRRRAMAQGGRESDRRQYLVIVAVHTLFYLSLWLEWKYWSHGWNAFWPIWLGLLAGAQVVRFWAILALGRHWNTRIIVLPQMKLVTRGPYRFIRHPNYLAVIIELVAIPVLCSAYCTAVIFSLANACILARRIPQEESALRQCGVNGLPTVPRFFPRNARIRPYPK